MAMNMAKTRKAAKKKNTPTTLANESTPRLKKDEEKIVKMRREIRQSKNAKQTSIKMRREICHYKKGSPKNRENDAWNSSKQKRHKSQSNMNIIPGVTEIVLGWRTSRPPPFLLKFLRYLKFVKLLIWIAKCPKLNITVHGFTKFQINNFKFFNHQIVL